MRLFVLLTAFAAGAGFASAARLCVGAVRSARDAIHRHDNFDHTTIERLNRGMHQLQR